MADQFEAWRNTGKGRVVVATLNDDGSEGRLVVSGDKKFRIKESDRKRHSREAILPQYDFFGNGTFVPVVDAIEDEEDAEEASAPNMNLLSEGEMRELAQGNGNTFNAALRKIDGEPALRRLLAISEEGDVPQSRAKKVRERLESLGFLTTDKHETVATFNDEQVDL